MPTPPNPNSDPLDDFEGLTPSQVHHLLRDFLGPGSLVKMRDNLEAHALPLPHFALRLLEELDEAEVRLTAKGNLPGKLVKAYYATGRLPDYAIESGLQSLRGEDDYPPLQAVKHLLLQTGWIKKRNNRLSLTARGEKARRGASTEFVRRLFLTHLQKFNLGWLDRYPESAALQHLCPYLIYLLLVLGDRERDSEAYAERMLRAFPILEEEFPGSMLPRAMLTRLFERFLAYYGFVEVTRESHFPPGPARVVATDHFRAVFYLDPDARPAPPSEEEQYERQLRTALFDAEMGSQSYVSDEIPLEMLDAFQQQIREIEELQSQGETVRIGDLLGDLPLLPPREIPDAATARREATRLKAALGERGIVLLEDEENQLDDMQFYAYLHDLLLNHEIVPPPKGTTRMVPFHEVFLAQFDPAEALTEAFLLALFDLENPFPADLLAPRMRLNNAVVPRARALQHLDDWRRQYRKITPLAFEAITDAPPVETPSDQQAVQLFMVAYEVVGAADSTPQAFEGPGVVEIMLENQEWRITGAHFPGFAF